MPSGSRSAVGPVNDKRLAELIEPVVAAAGMDLEAVRMSVAGKRRLLRIVVDGDGGVSLDDAADVSREISAMLDEANALGEVPYTLEVSSPGVDRPLTEPRHWRRAVGRVVSAPLRSQPGTSATAPDATVTGRVAGADSSGVRIDVDGASREFGYSDLGPGRIQIEFAPLDGYADDGADEEGPDGY